MASLVLRSLYPVGNDRRRIDRSRSRRRCRPGLESLEDRITPTSVTGVSPDAGPLVGGTSVTISGTGFTSVTAIDFGSVPATSVTLVSSTSITADSPAGSVGPADVTVTAAGGTSATSLSDVFTYAAVPTVSKLSPAGGAATGGTVVTISGSGFIGATAVDFGPIQATNLTIASDTTITVNSPVGTGTVDVTVTTPGGTSAIAPADEFTYVPTVAGISPAAGPPGGDGFVTITGLGFQGATAVDFGTTPALSFSVLSPSSILAESPAGSGTANVTVMTPSGTSAVLPADQFTYLAGPTVSGVSPAAGSLSGGTSVTITGTGFAGATAVDFGSTPATNLTVISNTTITVDSPAGNGMVGVNVTTPGGTSTSPPEFTYVAAPTVSGITPTGGPATGGTMVTISGLGFTDATAVEFGTTPATTFTLVSASAITAESPAGTGTVDVTVTTPGGTSAASASDRFAYAPTVSAISPAAGPTGGGTLVTITGTGFAGATEVIFGTTPGTIVTVSPTTITAYSPPGTNYACVTVTTPSGTSASAPADIFTYVAAPTVSGLSPASGSIGGGTLVMITGTGFLGATVVDFGTTPAFYFTVLSNTSITAASPQGTGIVNVSVTTPGGSSLATSPPEQFTYAPSVSGISPAAGPLQGGTLVSITGIGFTGTTSVMFGTNLGTIASISANTITVYSPAGTGTVDVTVITTPTAISAISPADQFSYVAAPTILAVSPSVGPLSGGTMVTITGNNLAGATAVDFGSVALASVVSDSLKQIVVYSPMGVSAGTVDVTVSTPGGISGASSSAQYTYNAAIAPVVTGISPQLGPPGGGTLVTIMGSGFEPAIPTAVLFGTNPAMNVSVISSTIITAMSPAGSGTVNITVVSSSGMSPPTAGDVFTYTADGPRVTSVQRYGYHAQPTYLVIDFNGSLEDSSAQDTSNYGIVGPGKQRIKVKSAVYSSTDDSVKLVLGRRLSLRKTYMLTIRGMAPSGVENPAGVFLDGMGTGQPGTNYVTAVTKSNLAGPVGKQPVATFVKVRAESVVGVVKTTLGERAR
jgi:hypothetical protein